MPLLQTVKISCLRSASNDSMEVKGFISLPVQKWSLYKKAGFVVVPGLTSNLLLGSSSISLFIEKISPRAGTISPISSGPVAIAEAAKKRLAMQVESDEHQKPVEEPCVITQSVRLPPMSETFVQVKASAGEIYSVETYKNLARRHQALVSLVIVDTVSATPFDI